MIVSDLAGSAAVVTGGASGIGRGICRSFARAGLAVVVADIDVAGAEALAKELRAGDARALAAEVDVAQSDSVEALAERAFAELGDVRVLCNNAGVVVGGTLEEATDEDWRWTLDVNLRGVIHGCRHFVPRMRERGRGAHIVNTASIGGFISAPGVGVYCATKFAVVGFSDALRSELEADGIGVSVLCPGGVRTNLLEADRNRPAPLARTAGRAEVLRPAIDAGIDPDRVGDHVLRGIANDSPYIFTHPEYRDVLERRFRAVVAAFDT